MPVAIDLFRGAGGWSLAARRLGIEDWGIENAKWANATAEAAGFTTAWGDVWTLPRISYDTGLDGTIASPPCPTFSVAGNGAGRRHMDTVLNAIRNRAWTSLERVRAVPTDDERTNLVLVPLWAVRAFAPEWVAWEQVPAVLPIWEACAEVMRRNGYSVWTGYLHAEQYGVPQTRKRAFLMASRDHEVEPPAPTHSKYHNRSPERLDEGVKPWVSMAEALGRGLASRPSPTVTGGGTATGGAEPISHLARYIESDDWVLRGGVSRKDGREGVYYGTERELGKPAPTIQFGHDAASWQFVQRSNYSAPSQFPGQTAAERGLGERTLDQPSFALTGKPPRWATETKAERITVTEAGILQSFPADHPWQGGKQAQYLQVGNAIPPLLAEAVLGQLTIQRESRIK